MFISSFWSKPLIWVPVSFLSLLVPYSFSFISLFIGFIFPSNLWPYSTNSVSILITSVLNCASHRLAITLLLSCIFSGALICSFIWAIFVCVCRWACYIVRGRALGVHQGGATQLLCCGTVGGGGVQEGTVPLAPLCRFSVTFPAAHKQIGPFWC